MAAGSDALDLEGDLAQLLQLVRDSDSIELKATVPDASHRSTISALDLDPLNAQIRQVFFFDTPDLALNQAGVVARARRIQGRDHDSVVKLRPVVPSELPADLRRSPNLSVEVDAIPGAYVCSATMKRTLAPTVIHEAVHGQRPLRKLFSKEQRAFFDAHAPDTDDLSTLGPIFVLKLKLMPTFFSRKLVVEMWLYPDGSRILELSTKCAPGEGLDVATEVRAALAAKGIEIGGEQQTKTKSALEFYSAELRAGGA